MPANPFTDVLHFLIGTAHDYNPFGASRYISVLFYLLVIGASCYVAWRNWTQDPSQRTAKHVFIWLMRLTAAAMWYQGTLWKLPLPVSGAFMYWTGALAKYTSFAAHAWLVKTVFLPYIAVLQPVIYLTEIFFTVTLSLGLFTRLAGVLVVLSTAHLWIGLYNDPTEWPWTYIAIMISHGMFVAAEAGRSLGMDNLLRRNPPAVVTRNDGLRRAFELAT